MHGVSLVADNIDTHDGYGKMNTAESCISQTRQPFMLGTITCQSTFLKIPFLPSFPTVPSLNPNCLSISASLTTPASRTFSALRTVAASTNRRPANPRRPTSSNSASASSCTRLLAARARSVGFCDGDGNTGGATLDLLPGAIDGGGGGCGGDTEAVDDGEKVG